VVSTLACTPPGGRAGEACLQMRRALQQGCRGPVLDTSTCQIRKDTKGAISEWPSYVIIKGDQWSSEVAITSFEHEDAREEMEQRQQPMRDSEQCRMT
jgi:hypothetical protein